MSDLRAAFAELETENARLRAKIEDLEFALGRRWVAPRRLKLCPREEDILGMILSRDAPISQEQIQRALYVDQDAAPMPSVVQVHVSKLRKKLKAFGVVLSSGRYVGYWIEPEQRAKFLEIFRDESVALESTVPGWVPPALSAEYDRLCRRFGEFDAARFIRNKLHPDRAGRPAMGDRAPA